MKAIASETSLARGISRRRIQSVGFACALVLVFLRFSALPEIIASVTGANSYVLYIFAPVAVLAVIARADMQRVFREKPARFWLWFVLWMVFSVPFSSWKSGSFRFVVTYLETDFVMLVTIAGLTRKWVDCRRIIYAVAMAAAFDIAAAYLPQDVGNNRFGFALAGTIGNSNDLAAHLLLVVPFLLFVALKPRTGLFIRLLSISAAVSGTFEILRTASRGALVALLLTTILVFVRGSIRQKAAVVAGVIVAFLFLALLLPSSTRQRLTSFSRGSDSSEEAMESSDIRQYLLKQSIVYTLENPFFGVGPNQFSSYEGQHMTKTGHQLGALWRPAHNSYTQISSDCGIPALVFYLAAGISTFGLLAKIRKRAKSACQQEIVIATRCLTIGLIAYSTAIFFVNFAYYYEFPAVSGLVIGMWFAVNRKAPMPGYADTSLRQPVPDLPGMECFESGPPAFF